MRTIIIGPSEAGQRLDRYLHKYMKEAPSSFLYKMIRKKNIVLNRSRCEGGQLLQAGDRLELFLSEETLAQFGAGREGRALYTEYERAYRQLGRPGILYEDGDILAVNKPAGMLSQKADSDSLSLNEWLIGRLLEAGELQAETLDTFRPSVCNRLDRNTSGIVLCGKTMAGLQLLSGLLRERRMDKIYRLIALGEIGEAAEASGWLQKAEAGNRAVITAAPAPGAQPVRTGIRPLCTGMLPGIGRVTAAEAALYTGKSHQIRAQFAALSHPLLGDIKYGDPKANAAARECYGIRRQMLHACRVRFPEALPERFSHLAGLVITAPMPADLAGAWEAVSGDGGRETAPVSAVRKGAGSAGGPSKGARTDGG